MELTRMHASRALRSIAFVVGTIAAGGVSAATPALVVDVDSGKVLYAERATDPWFPASITKLMTTYVALDMVRSGRASMDQLLTLSPEASVRFCRSGCLKPGRARLAPASFNRETDPTAALFQLGARLSSGAQPAF